MVLRAAEPDRALRQHGAIAGVANLSGNQSGGASVRFRGLLPSHLASPCNGAPPIAALANQLIPTAPRCFQADPKADGAAAFPWWLVYCTTGQELSLASRLELAGVPHFLPLARYDRRTPTGKRRVTDKALFPGYLFVTGPYGLAYTKPSTLKGLVSSSPVADVPGLIADLSRLCDVIATGAPLGEARSLQAGAQVKVVSGMFEGFTGTLIRENGQDLLLIEVQAMGQAVPLAIEAWRVERV